MKFNLLLFLAIFILVGCESKNHVLFSKDQELTNIINNNQKSIYRYKIKPYDRISVLFYEHPDLSTRKVGDFQEDTVGILVNSDGTASFPLIGDLKVEGMYVDDLKKKIEELASEFIINPSVNINIINHRVFVLGEVNSKLSTTHISLFCNLSERALLIASLLSFLFILIEKFTSASIISSLSDSEISVEFDIKSATPNSECKKDQKWKFVSNGEILVLDHRKML